jgi:hypothetical protein
MKLTKLTTLAAALVAMFVSSVSARPILMTLDGEADSNILRAVQLQHTVTGRTLAQINAMTQAQLSAYDTVFVSPDLSLMGYGALRSAVADGGSLQMYVATGGTLVVNVAGRVGSQHDIAPGGVDYVGGTHNNGASFVSAAHPLLTGAGYNGHSLNPSDFSMWLHTDHGYIDPSSLTMERGVAAPIEITENTFGPSVVEYAYGDGRVVLTTLTVGWAMGGQARGDVQDNLINYVVPEPASLTILAISSMLVLRRRRLA